MIYQDCIFGRVKIDEPVILDLIRSRALQRLKGVDQGGYQPLYAKPKTKLSNKRHHNRFAHSLGVYLLLRAYGAPLEERVAGLIHDVSHSCFSHCADYFLDSGSPENQSHQDNIFSEHIKKTEIPAIIKKHWLDLDYILDDKNFPLKERLLPDLCADRIDYSLRSALVFEEISPAQVKALLDNLLVENGRWIFENLASARKFSKVFLKMNQVYYAGVHSATMFMAVADCLKYALINKYFDLSDLYSVDKIILDKIKKAARQDKKLKRLWDRMNNKIAVKNNKEDFEAKIICKSRIVDPLFKRGGRIMRLSEVDKKWAEIVKKELMPKEYYLKFER